MSLFGLRGVDSIICMRAKSRGWIELIHDGFIVCHADAINWRYYDNKSLHSNHLHESLHSEFPSSLEINCLYSMTMMSIFLSIGFRKSVNGSPRWRRSSKTSEMSNSIECLCQDLKLTCVTLRDGRTADLHSHLSGWSQMVVRSVFELIIDGDWRFPQSSISHKSEIMLSNNEYGRTVLRKAPPTSRRVKPRFPTAQQREKSERERESASQRSSDQICQID
jgi:hypothetical protein